jgi:hypothetical protein
MCAHYHSVTHPALLQYYFGVDAPTDAAKSDVWPGCSSVFIRRHPHADVKVFSNQQIDGFRKQ